MTIPTQRVHTGVSSERRKTKSHTCGKHRMVTQQHTRVCRRHLSNKAGLTLVRVRNNHSCSITLITRMLLHVVMQPRHDPSFLTRDGCEFLVDVIVVDLAPGAEETEKRLRHARGLVIQCELACRSQRYIYIPALTSRVFSVSIDTPRFNKITTRECWPVNYLWCHTCGAI